MFIFAVELTRGQAVPLFCTRHICQMNIIEIKDAIEKEIVARKMFFVDIRISADNEVTLTLEKEEGSVSLDDCVAVSELFEAAFDREKEDYSLTVSSAGLDQPFKVQGQFTKALGTRVEAWIKGGRKLIATLEAADGQQVTLHYTALEKAEGSKKKVKVVKHEVVPMEQVVSVRPYIEIN